MSERTIRYRLDPGEYELRTYGCTPTCATCTTPIVLQHSGELTITLPEGRLVDLKRTDKEEICSPEA